MSENSKNWSVGIERENLENLGNIISSFLISKFLIFPYSQNWKLGFKNLGKKFPRFPSFRPGLPFEKCFRCYEKYS